MPANTVTLPSREAGIVRNLWTANASVFLCVTLAAFIFSPSKVAFSVTIGGLVALLNFRLMERTIIRTLMPHKNKGTLGTVLFKYYLRFTVTAVCLGVLVRQGVVEPLGLLVGLSVVVVGIITFGAFFAHRLYKEAY